MTIKLPSLLSFERKLETSDALMYSGNWDDVDKNEAKENGDNETAKEENLWNPIRVLPRFNRSTQSAEGIDDTKKTNPNPVSSGNDDANLPYDKDTLKVSFTLRVIGNVGTPFACNDFSFGTKIKDKVNVFKTEGEKLQDLALRYAYNIANGRFLWRNRVGAEDITVHVFDNETNLPLVLKPYDFSLKNFNKDKDNLELHKLAKIILKGLGSESDFVFIRVDAYVKLGAGQHVFPSEEMNMNEKGKTLFKLNECAAMHNVKIGNAIRTIDDWYDNNVLIKTVNKSGKEGVTTVVINDIDRCPIAIEPYGSVTQRGCAYRAKDEDLYTLMVKWVNDKDLSDSDKKYVVANFIRGGVFSRASK